MRQGCLRGYLTKIRAASFQGPEEVSVFRAACRCDGAIGKDDLRCFISCISSLQARCGMLPYLELFDIVCCKAVYLGEVK